MIVTVTPNPSVDWTLEVPLLVRGEVHRISGQHQEPSGKGVNVSRALTSNGVATLAVVPLGGAEGVELAALLRAEGVRFVPVPIEGAVRVNISLTEPDGTATKVNAAGPTLAAGEADALLAAAASSGTGASWLLGSGSLPRGAPADLYARLGDAARDAGARYALDSSGAALRAGLAARPHVIKPNVEELAEAVGRPLPTMTEVVRAARELMTLGAGSAVVSLGRDGALLVDAEGVLHAEAAVGSPRSTVGAGDALLAGYLAGTLRPGAGREDALREAVAWGSAAVGVPGSHVPSVPDSLRRAVVVHGEVDGDRRLDRPDRP